MCDGSQMSQISPNSMDAPAALAKCRRQHYRAVAAELIFSNKSRSPNCGRSMLMATRMTPSMPNPGHTLVLAMCQAPLLREMPALLSRMPSVSQRPKRERAD